MKNTILVLLSILFVPMFLYLIIFASLDNTLLNPKLVNSKLERVQAYQKLATEVIPTAISQLFSSTTNSLSQNQAITNIKDQVSSAVNESWIKQQFNNIYSQTTNYITDQTENTNINLDLQPIADIFKKDNLFNIIYTDTYIKEQYDSLSICTDQESNEELCRQESLTYDDFKNAFINEVKNNENPLENIFPENLNLYQTLEDSGNNVLSTAANIYQTFKTIYNIFLISCLLIIITIISLLFKEKARMFKYLGIIFIIPAIPALIISIAGYLLFAGLISKILLVTQLPETTITIIISILGSLFNSFNLWMLVASLVSLILSIIFLILAKKYKNNLKED